MSSDEKRAPFLSREQRDAVVAHMNEDHTDAVLLYARELGTCSRATTATMVDIDELGIALEVQEDGAAKPVRIDFHRPLSGVADARRTLIAMAAEARDRMAARGRET